MCFLSFDRLKKKYKKIINIGEKHRKQIQNSRLVIFSDEQINKFYLIFFFFNFNFIKSVQVGAECDTHFITVDSYTTLIALASAGSTRFCGNRLNIITGNTASGVLIGMVLALTVHQKLGNLLNTLPSKLLLIYVPGKSSQLLNSFK